MLQAMPWVASRARHSGETYRVPLKGCRRPLGSWHERPEPDGSGRVNKKEYEFSSLRPFIAPLRSLQTSTPSSETEQLAGRLAEPLMRRFAIEALMPGHDHRRGTHR